MHKILFYNKFIICLYIFRALCAHHQEVKIVWYSIWYHHTCRWPSRAQVKSGLLLEVRLLSNTCYNSTLNITPYGLSENAYSVYLQPPSVSEPKQNSNNLPPSSRQFQSYTSLSIPVGFFDFVEGKRPVTIKLNLQEIGFGGTCTVLIWIRTETSGGLWWMRK